MSRNVNQSFHSQNFKISIDGSVSGMPSLGFRPSRPKTGELPPSPTPIKPPAVLLINSLADWSVLLNIGIALWASEYGNIIRLAHRATLWYGPARPHIWFPSIFLISTLKLLLEHLHSWPLHCLMKRVWGKVVAIHQFEYWATSRNAFTQSRRSLICDIFRRNTPQHLPSLLWIQWWPGCYMQVLSQESGMVFQQWHSSFGVGRGCDSRWALRILLSFPETVFRGPQRPLVEAGLLRYKEFFVTSITWNVSEAA